MKRIEIEPEAKQVLNMIVDIQLEAIQSIKDYPQNNRELAAKLIQQHESDWNTQIDRLTAMYQNIKSIPNAIILLDEYQLLVCSHILFRMEAIWMYEYSYGISSLWTVIHECMEKFHPEYKLISTW
ncbi:MAG: hypothetical protein NC131_06075 [Roseburia sp.]|nr:hypothetical protein [Roseburia sp.]